MSISQLHFIGSVQLVNTQSFTCKNLTKPNKELKTHTNRQHWLYRTTFLRILVGVPQIPSFWSLSFRFRVLCGNEMKLSGSESISNRWRRIRSLCLVCTYTFRFRLTWTPFESTDALSDNTMPLEQVDSLISETRLFDSSVSVFLVWDSSRDSLLFRELSLVNDDEPLLLLSLELFFLRRRWASLALSTS